MAHQTFYIDIDEEITSIVDRIRKAKAEEVVIVVPKRALLIQSVVNLKLLKKEADNFKRDVTIVTQDKLGRILIEKTGLAVQQRLEDVDGEEFITSEEEANSEETGEFSTSFKNEDLEKRSRIDSIGSSEYFEALAPKTKKRNTKIKITAAENKNIKSGSEKIINRELVTGITDDIKKKPSVKSSVPMDLIKNISIKQAGSDEEQIANKESGKKTKDKKNKIIFKSENINPENDELTLENDKMEKFFNGYEGEAKKFDKAKIKDDYGKVNISGKSRKFFWSFTVLIFIIMSISVAYLFLPKATVKIFAKEKIQSIDLTIKGDMNISETDFENQTIASKIISANEELSESFETTGNKDSSSKKAQGLITIYNEYSSSPQPLVATTRFLSDGGKIFRLVKGITVPGTTKVGAEIKPGAIEAEVIADEAGEDYNIGSSSFTIPGFKDSGNEKYSKFYAKSFNSMNGGGSGKETVRVVSKKDIEGAKNKISLELNRISKQKIKDTADEGYFITDDAISINDAIYTLSNSENEVADKFTITGKAKVVAIAFNDSDFKEIAKRSFVKNNSAAKNLDKESILFDFGKSDVDFGNGKIVIRASASAKILPEIDLENIKKGILGKNEDDLRAFLSVYSELSGAEVEYWPTFISGKIPSYGSRVKVILDSKQ